MIKKYLILILSLIYFQNGFSQLDTISDDSLADYYFDVEIDMNHLNRNDNFNYKYLINKSWIGDDLDKSVFLQPKMLYFIQYDYQQDSISGFDKYKRVPLDTLIYRLTSYQLDSIYYLTCQIFRIDNDLEVKEDIRRSDIYDGEYLKVSLRLKNYSTNFDVTTGFNEESVFQNRILDLLHFVEIIKNGL